MMCGGGEQGANAGQQQGLSGAKGTVATEGLVVTVEVDERRNRSVALLQSAAAADENQFLAAYGVDEALKPGEALTLVGAGCRRNDDVVRVCLRYVFQGALGGVESRGEDVCVALRGLGRVQAEEHHGS